MKFIVYETRTKTITYSIEATDAEDAEARYLMEGDEVGSKISGNTEIEVIGENDVIWEEPS